jgi:hypothetical protein
LKEKEKLRKASKIGIIVLLSLMFASISAAVYADVQVYIMNPLSSDAKGVVSASCWVGEIPITASGDDAPCSQQTTAYCMNFDKTVYVGNTYAAGTAAVADTAEWKAVSYLLTWYNPPAGDNDAAANQVAIWRILDDNYVKPSWLSTSIDNAGNALASEVEGKDVIRQGDMFQWIEPVTTNQSAVMGNPGETITFKAKLTDASGTPRPNVKVLFTAVLRPDDVELDASNLNPVVTHTDDDGVAMVTVTVPDDIQNGESIEVKASTKSVWPQLYLNLTDDRRQDLIGLGTCFELTVSTNVCVLASILVIPEVPLGTLTAGAACAFAFVFWKRDGQLKKQKLS